MKEVKELVIEISRGRAVDIPKIKAYGKRQEHALGIYMFKEADVTGT